MAKSMKNAFLAITGFITCPCHLPLVLPALAVGLAGTAVGAFISENTGLLIALATVYFAGVVIYFVRGRKSGGSETSAETLER